MTPVNKKYKKTKKNGLGADRERHEYFVGVQCHGVENQIKT